MKKSSRIVNFPCLVTPLDALKDHVFLDGTNVTSCIDDWGVKKAAKAATGQIVTLVLILATIISPSMVMKQTGKCRKTCD